MLLAVLVIPARHAVKVENRSGPTFFVHRVSLSSLSVADSFPRAISICCSRSHVKYVLENRRKIKLIQFSSFQDDSMATVRVLRSGIAS